MANTTQTLALPRFSDLKLCMELCVRVVAVPFIYLMRASTCACVLFLKCALCYLPLSFFSCARKFAWYPRTPKPVEPKDSLTQSQV